MKIPLQLFCLAQVSIAAITGLTGLEYSNDTLVGRVWNRHISRDRLRIVDLTNIVDLEANCPKESDGIFHSCFNTHSSVKLLKSPDRSDMTPWMMPLSTYFDDNMTKPELSRPFAPHLVAVRDSFVCSWGYIFNFEQWFVHGGCTDKSYYSPNFDYDMSSQTVAMFNEPVLSLVHPYPGIFYHEYVELHSALLMSMPLLKIMPNITIIVNRHLRQTHIFPLLKIMGIDPEDYNFLSLKSNNRASQRNANLLKSSKTLVYAPYIVTPISMWCQYISRTTTNQMREMYSKLPYWGEPGNGIVIFDRYNMRPKRSLAQGAEIFDIVKRTYGPTHSVRMYYGNESLEETVRVFRGCRVLIAAHGGGQSNMMFMPTGGSVIEIRPNNWPITCFIDIANNIGVKHFMFVDNRHAMRKHPEMYVVMSTFVPWMNGIINNALNTHLVINYTSST